MRSRIALWCGVAALSLGACGDPARDDRIDALGPEQPGVPTGPPHRPGQPCTLCHGGRGPGSPTFSVAGTVFREPGVAEPVQGVAVELTDSDGDFYWVPTNCAGNFYITEDAWKPRFPLWVTLRYGDVVVDMETAVQRDGSCAGCHTEPPAVDSPGHVYLSETPINAPGGCR